MSNIGTRRELQVRDWYREQGWVAFRAPASLGVADVVAMKAGQPPHLVEVKASKRGPFADFRPADRRELLKAADTAGAVALLAHWPVRGELRFIPEYYWPGA